MDNLIKTLTIIVNVQNAYGKKHDLAQVLAFMRFKLEKRYTPDQIVWAIDQYTDRNDDIPTPSDIINILSPEPARITEAEFVEAQKWQENNGYPMFSAARDTINEYKKQSSEARSEVKLPDKFMELVSQSIKRIE